ncbi:FUSC family protein [Nocardiopsis ansamitocini]|uniref:Aromatic acid exporter family member 1 n=1 Tax=Nocardiopsis ansamitocini TaxID=1670832 RepID=A0A9W6P7S1_9ACTN|nr:hypothetical protein [Nocardiopsis ansamitocini]GLU48583.1 hypothetical protein Nans01_29340 [Nocardiopsis ansamitocini]
MAQVVPGRRTWVAEQGPWARSKQWLRRAAGSESHERHTLLSIGKSTLAASVSWLIAYHLMQASSAAFAPFSALLMMQVTVYQSVAQSLRYVAAVAAGVALQGLIGFAVNPDMAAFVLVTLVALVIGRWSALGTQGSQVATAAFFAFSTYVSTTGTVERLTQLGQIIVLVLIGCAVGILVNLLVFPPMRYRSAEYGIRSLAHALCDLVGDIHPSLSEDSLDPDSTDQWRTRAERMQTLVEQARSGVQTAQESVYLNPRGFLRRHRGHTSFTGYAALVEALDRVARQLVSVTLGLDQARWEDERGADHRAFVRGYGDLLAATGEITRLLSELDEDRLREQARHLCAQAERAQECRTLLSDETENGSLPLADHTRPYGILMVEATRLMDEFQYTCDLLQQCVDQALGRSECDDGSTESTTFTK